MADHSITRETMLQSLQDVRLPTDAAGGLLAELAAAAASGLMLALAVSLLVPLFTRPKPHPTGAPDLAAHIAALHALPESELQVELLRLMRTHAPDLLDPDPQQIYARGGIPDAAALKRMLLEKVPADA